MNVFIIAGARPNFMKIAPIVRAARNHPQVTCKIVHTGQHYDYEMSQAFFQDLEIPEPDFYLNAGSGTHAEQTGHIMMAFEKLCEKERPSLVIVVGDVNSTLACAIVAKKMFIEVAHVEAGLRSFDLNMPEEVNRMVTDVITDRFFVTEKSAEINLLSEGKDKARIHFVGHVMIDNLLYQLNRMKDERDLNFPTVETKQSNPGYAFLTLHRPSNVDSKTSFAKIISAINKIAEERPILFSVHPRTKKMIEKHDVPLSTSIVQLPPLAFRESLFLWKDADLVITDSGGLQEETTALRVPCLTLRNNTERPITIEMGSNVLGGTTETSILNAYQNVLTKNPNAFQVPPKWDGKAADRIWSKLIHHSHRQDSKV